MVKSSVKERYGNLLTLLFSFMETQSLNRIIQGDSFKVLPSFDADSVDLICTSPPYADARKDTYGGVKVDEYVDWFLPISKELYRVLKPSGSFILNIKEKVVNGERSTYVMELVLALRKQGWLWTEEYIWHKRCCFPGKWPNRFKDAWEHCYQFTKNKQFAMYQDSVKKPFSRATVERISRMQGNDFKRMNYTETTGSHFGQNRAKIAACKNAYPSNVLYLATESHNRGHSAVFPIGLPTFFIKLFSKAGDVVLDPFCGSGTTCLAAKQLGRLYLGIELNPVYASQTQAELGGCTVLSQFA